MLITLPIQPLSHQMSRLHIALVILCLITKSVSHRARILGLFPFPAKSHIAISASLMLELANRGHQVTVIRHYPEDPPHPNITDVTLGEVDYRQHKRKAFGVSFCALS